MRFDRIEKLLVSAVLVAVGAWASAATPWQPKQGPLMTRWAKDVNPERPLPEYPRPQMVRESWESLNGLWQYADATPGEGAPYGKELSEQILVPFCPESALSGVMRPAERVWYRRTFTTPREWEKKRVLLHFGAVDWETSVSVNGQVVGTHRGGYDPFSFDITKALKGSGPQEIVVGVYDPTQNGAQPRGKQNAKPHGIFYTPATGIWQTVWLEAVPQAAIGKLCLTPDVDDKSLKITVEGSGTSFEKLTVEATAFDTGTTAGSVAGKIGEPLRLAIDSPKLWSPDNPFLYDLKVTLKDGQKKLDEVESYFGMRKIEVASADGKPARILLNGKPFFMTGPLDQGYWPDGIYTAPTDKALRWDIEATKKLGFNMARKHVKVEPARWYYYADKLGLLVWQDMPSGFDTDSKQARAQHENELRALVENLRNHPSIIMWVVFNEGWGQFDTERLTKLTKQLDPSRLASNASGWTDKGVGDIVDLHMYPGPGCPNTETTRAAVLGEFGGLGLSVEKHTWNDKGWGYQGTGGKEDLTHRYERLFTRVWELKDTPGLNAAVYTQLTDVEGECNGLYTYDREVLKVDGERVAAVNSGKVSSFKIETVVPTSQEKPIGWHYTFEKPADGWEKENFDDRSWDLGMGGFGTEGTPGAVVRTKWNTDSIWLRRDFTLPENVNLETLCFLIDHDESVEVYLNGVRALRENGFTNGYVDTQIAPDARKALKPGQKNVMAVRCRQTEGGQSVDVGLVNVVPASNAKP